MAKNLFGRQYSDSEASNISRTIAESLSRLRDKDEIYCVIWEKHGRVSVDLRKMRKRLASVKRGIDQLLAIMMKKEQEEEEYAA